MRHLSTLLYFIFGVTIPCATYGQSIADLAKMAGIDLKEIGAGHMLNSPSPSSSASSSSFSPYGSMSPYPSMSPYGTYSPLASSSPSALGSSVSPSAAASHPGCSNCGKSGCPGCADSKAKAFATSSTNGYPSYPSSYGSLGASPYDTQYNGGSGYGALGGGVEALSALSSVYSPSMNGFAGPFGGYGSPEANFMAAGAYSSPSMSPYMSQLMSPSPYGDSMGGSYGGYEAPESPNAGKGGQGEEEEGGEYSRPQRPSSHDDEPERDNSGRPDAPSSQYRGPSQSDSDANQSSGSDYDRSPSLASARVYGHRGYAHGHGRNYRYES